MWFCLSCSGFSEFLTGAGATTCAEFMSMYGREHCMGALHSLIWDVLM